MTTPATAVGYTLLGLGLGVAHFALLRRNVRRYVEGGVRPSAVLLHLGRLALVGLGFFSLARFGGPMGLLAAFVGFLAARPFMTARTGRPA